MSGSDDDVETFERSESGASGTYPCQAGNLKKGGYVMINNRPCKITEISTSKTGKHGHAKANIVAVDIFNGRKYEEVAPTSHNLDVPTVNRMDFSLIDISDDGFTSLLNEDGTQKEGLRLPEGELGEQIKTAFNAGTDVIVSVQSAVSEEAIISFKTTSA